MKWIFKIKKWQMYGLYVLLNTICMGMGMGVPIFCILFGFIVGWYIARVGIYQNEDIKAGVRKFLPIALITSGYTFVLMLLLWGRLTGYLFDPNADYVNLGIPMILFDPRVSFIGWQVLMIFISPFLQLLTTLFGSYITLLSFLRLKSKYNEIDIQTIENSVKNYYHDGHALYDPELYRQVLHPEWKFFLIEDEKLKIVDREEFCGWYSPENLRAELEWETQIISIDITGNLAAVKLNIEHQEIKYIDYLNMMKIDGKWWIVHKISHSLKKK